MDQLGNDCPCKRQRVSEGDDIDQETGMHLKHATGSHEFDYCTSRDTTVNEKGDSVEERETIQWHPSVEGAGDFKSKSDCVGEGSQSTQNDCDVQSSSEENSAMSLQKQANIKKTGSQEGNENMADVKNCSLNLNQPLKITQNVKSHSGFCEYVQNVQAIAENSYMSNRERYASKVHRDLLQKLESPKLKRPMDRVNTNLVKKKMDTLPSSDIIKEELSKIDAANNNKHNKVSSSDQLTFKKISVDSKAGNIIEDKKNEDVQEKPEFGDNAIFANKVGMNNLENSDVRSIETCQDTSNSAGNVDIEAETVGSCRFRHDKGLQGDGFNESCFVEMFSNSVMGNIMSGSGTTGSLRNYGKQVSDTVNAESYKASIKGECIEGSRRVCLNKIQVKDDGSGDSDLGIEGKVSTHTHELDEVLRPNIKENTESTRDPCKFQGFGNLLTQIGGCAESNKPLVKAGDVENINDLTSLRSESSDLGKADDILNSVSENKTGGSAKHTTASHLHAGQSMTYKTNRKVESNNAFTVVSTKDFCKSADLEVLTDDDQEKSTLINGRFKLDFHETQVIVNQGNINRLPITVIVHILKNLTAFQLLRRVSCVCKYWYNVCRDPDVWRRISLVNQHRLSDFDFKRILHFSDCRVRILNLTDSRFITNHGIKYLIMSCPLLEELRLMRCFDLTDAAFEGLSSVGVCNNLQELYMDACCRITDKTVLEVAKACHRLRILNLNQCTRISDTSMIGIAKNCPRLTTLQLDHCSQVTDTAMSEIVLGCPEILYLNLMSCGITDTGVKYLSKLRKLSNLDLSNIPRLTSDSVIYLSKFCKNLQCINVSLNTMMDDKCISQLAKNLPVLKRLYCVSCSITDKGLEDIAKYCPNLEALDVGWCQEVTDSGVRVISLSCKYLDYFGLIRCDRVTLETIEELVLKHPSINYSTFILESRRLLERARNEGYQFKLLNLP